MRHFAGCADGGVDSIAASVIRAGSLEPREHLAKRLRQARELRREPRIDAAELGVDDERAARRAPRSLRPSRSPSPSDARSSVSAATSSGQASMRSCRAPRVSFRAPCGERAHARRLDGDRLAHEALGEQHGELDRAIELALGSALVAGAHGDAPRRRVARARSRGPREPLLRPSRSRSRSPRRRWRRPWRVPRRRSASASACASTTTAGTRVATASLAATARPA